MFSGSRFAYRILVAIVLFVPAWGCNSEPPETPPEVQRELQGLETKSGEFKAPEIDLGSGTEKGSDTRQGSDAKKGSDTKGD
jgi:hypothetical protein